MSLYSSKHFKPAESVFCYMESFRGTGWVWVGNTSPSQNPACWAGAQGIPVLLGTSPYGEYSHHIYIYKMGLLKKLRSSTHPKPFLKILIELLY